MEVPEDPETTFVVVQKTGSSKTNYIYSATFAIQSYAGSLLDAAELNEQVKAAMDDIIVLDEISRSELNSDYPFTDESEKRYRYQAVYDLFHY
ncbi:MAG: hypothetical protein IJH64_01990 [Oscillospiraceae bacterium]|nr:hypothetical protein [Oscillospiraceae bacterium]